MAQSPIEAQRIVGLVSAQALQDAEYRAKLQAAPEAVLIEAGLELPNGVVVKVLSQFEELPAGQTDPGVFHLVIGATSDQLSHEELGMIAGGVGSCANCASTLLTIPSTISSTTTASTVCG